LGKYFVTRQENKAKLAIYPPNSKNMKLMQFFVGLFDRAHKNAATERIRFKVDSKYF